VKFGGKRALSLSELATVLVRLDHAASHAKRILAAITCGAKKSRRIHSILRLFIGDISGRPSIDYNPINHMQIAPVREINTHVRAGFNLSSDHFAVLVEDVTRPVKDVGAWTIGTILANNKCLDRLVIGRRPFLACHFDDGSGHRYFLSGTCALLFSIRLRKRQRRQQCAANKNRNWFFHVMPPVDGFT
jgi:hypothetical protein